MIADKDFSEWAVAEATEAIADAIALMPGGQEAFDANKAFVEDQDHWQEGDAWIGPNGGSDAELETLVLAAVERQLVAVDAIGEVLHRVANALLRREADVDLIPLEAPEEDSEEEARLQEEAADIKAQLSHWWDQVKLWELARLAVKRSRWSTRGALRLWIGEGGLEVAKTDSGQVTRLPTGLEFADALGRLQLSAPTPDEALVHVDPDTQERVGIFLFEDENEQQAVELWYLDEDDKAVLRIAGDGQDEEEQFSVNLKGRLPILEMEADLLITGPVRVQQKRLNFFESVMVRVTEAAGFPERYTLNAEPDGIWLTTPPTAGPALKVQEYGGRTYYLHAAPRTLGAAITTHLVGVQSKADANGTSIATPGVVFKEPTDPDFAIKASRHAHLTILRTCRQGHLAVDSTAESSGLAYEQARADFEDDLWSVKVPLEGLLRDTIETAIVWAEAMSTMEGGSILDRFRVSVTLNVKSGPVTPLAQQQNNANVQSGTLSHESAMAANGVEDVDAELQKIRAQPEAMMNLRTKQLAQIAELVREGLTWELAARMVGIEDEEELKLFQEADVVAGERRRQEAEQDDETDDLRRLLTGTSVTPPLGASA